MKEDEDALRDVSEKAQDELWISHIRNSTIKPFFKKILAKHGGCGYNPTGWILISFDVWSSLTQAFVRLWKLGHSAEGYPVKIQWRLAGDAKDAFGSHFDEIQCVLSRLFDNDQMEKGGKGVRSLF